MPLAHGQIAYFDIGEGQPFLLLHGFPDTPHTFRHQVPALVERGYRCIVPYLPGYGASSPPHRGGNSILAITEMIEEFVARLVPGEKVHIYGHDWGSLIAQCMSSLHLDPKQPPAYTLDKLMLCAVPPLRHFVTNLNWRQLYRSRYFDYFQRPGVVATIQQQKLAYIRTLWSRWSPGVPPNDAQAEDVVATLGTGDCLRQAILYYRYFLNPLYIPFGHHPLRLLWHLFRKKPMPCLIIVGVDDGCIGREIFKGSANGYPHPLTRLLEIPGAGHFTHYEAPEAVNRALLDFIEQT